MRSKTQVLILWIKLQYNPVQLLKAISYRALLRSKPRLHLENQLLVMQNKKEDRQLVVKEPPNLEEQEEKTLALEITRPI